MIQSYESDLGQSVLSTELYDYLGLAKSQYSRFIKKELIDSFYFELNKDYSTRMSSNMVAGKQGQFRQEFNIHIDAAKKLCMISKSTKGNEIRNELVKLTKEVEGGKRLLGSEFISLIRMVKVFAVYEYRRLAMKKNSDNFIKNAIIMNPELGSNRNFLYGQFHKWRNETLNTGKEVLSERVKEYCLIEHRRIPAKFTQDEALTMMGEYEQIKNAIWDLLSSQNKSEEMINNICDLAQEVAKELKPFLERLNQSNLFFQQIEAREIKAIGLK
jgi:phage anti-repressor protein